MNAPDRNLDREVDPGTGRGRLVHGVARHPRRLHRPEHDPHRPRRVDRAARVDGQRLQPDLRRPADGGRRDRRPLRAAAHPGARARRLHPRLGPLRARPEHRLADRGARPAGGGRRLRPAARADRGQRGLRPRAPGLGDRDPAGADGPGRRQRPGDRWRGDRRHRLGVDLLAQRPDRRGRPSRSSCAGSRRAAAPTRPSTCPGSAC